MAPFRHQKRTRSTFSTICPPLPSLFQRKPQHFRHSTGNIPEEPEEMPIFKRPIPSIRLTANPTREDQMNAFLSPDAHAELDIESSFASSMSLNSPPQTQRHLSLPDSDQDSRDYVPMDISPAPPRVFHAPPPQQANTDAFHRARSERERDRPSSPTLRLPLPSAADRASDRPKSYASTGPGRLFGTDVSNATSGSKKSDGQGSDKEKDGRRLQRTALPFEWMSSGMENTSRSQQSMDAPSSDSMDAMDVDTSWNSQSSSAPEPRSPISGGTIRPFNGELTDDEEPPISAAPTVTKLDNYFYRSSSPIGAPDFDDADASTSSMSIAEEPPKKKRSVSPPAPVPGGAPRRRGIIHKNLLDVDNLESSPAPMESPMVHKLERLNSKPVLRGLPLPALNANNKRPRRPVMSAVVGSSDVDRLHSAYPRLEQQDTDDDETAKLGRPEPKPRHAAAPVRRAFSAMIPPTVNPMEQAFESGGESSSIDYDGPDMSSPAQSYAKRQQGRSLRRRDGTDDFRTMGAGATLMRDGDLRAVAKKEREVVRVAVAERDTPRSKYLNGAGSKLGGFGDNEAHGKVLPCHRVREDGLMRITCRTLDALLDGHYDMQIDAFHVIDCRFDYEYDGGHIPSAININTTQGVEDFLLGARVQKPEPSMSGDAARKTILVFHCEFSQKRAPTFAKHLRSKDRMQNGHVYPRIHYPEVYILEGGYCQYFKESGARCQPPSYVRMDDPNYAHSRKEDLDQFRKGKFGRTKSYAYGEGKNGLLAPPMAVVQPKRNSAPTGVNALFAAGNAARSRRAPGMLQTLQEDSSGTIPTDPEDDETDIGDSPCPPPTKNVVFKGGKVPRMPLARADTYGPSRLLGR